MDYRTIVSNIYEVHDPAKIGQLEVILRTFHGREEALIKELRRKFNISDEEYEHVCRGGAPPPPPSYHESTIEDPMLGGGVGAAIPVQAQAVPYDQGQYITHAQDVKVHEDHIPLTGEAGGYSQSLGNRGVMQVQNPDGSVSYAVMRQGRGSHTGLVNGRPRAPTGHPSHTHGAHALSMRGFTDAHGTVVVVEEPVRGERQSFGYRCGRVCFTIYVVFVTFIVISSVISAIFSGPSEESDDDEKKNTDDDVNAPDDDSSSRRAMGGGLRGAVLDVAWDVVLHKASSLSDSS